MRILNLNPSRDIGASAWYLEIEGHRILLDAGVHPKLEGRESLPNYSLIEKEELDAIAISHCHHDHCGSLPVALRYFPKAHVLMTELSYFLIERVLHNSVNVMTRQREELGIKEYPFYSHSELDDIAACFQGFRYNREIEWASFHKTRAGFASPSIEFFDAGHALGSAGIMVRGAKQSFFYTGDVCFHDQTILRSARFEDVNTDVMLIETTRGSHAVPEGFTREAEIDRLADSIQSALKKKGSVLIPVFALGRTQEILATLALLIASGKLKNQPIYIGGLGRVFTEIYDLEAHRTHRQHANMRLNQSLDLVVLEKKQIEKMRLTGGKIFVLTAGMMSENTAAHDLAVRMVGDERHSIFFVGYSDPSTPGGRLKAAAMGEKFYFSKSGGELTLKCDIKHFDLTAHANRNEMLDFVAQVMPKTVLLGHGDADAMGWFEEQIRTRHPKIKLLKPEPGIPLDID